MLPSGRDAPAHEGFGLDVRKALALPLLVPVQMVGSSVMRSFCARHAVGAQLEAEVDTQRRLVANGPAGRPGAVQHRAVGQGQTYCTLVASAGPGSPKSSWMGDWVRSSLSPTA